MGNTKNISEYLEALVTYLVNSPGKLTEEELQEPVNRLIEEGVPLDIIAKASGFTTAQIKEFKEKMKDQQVDAAA